MRRGPRPAAASDRRQGKRAAVVFAAADRDRDGIGVDGAVDVQVI